MVFLILEIYMNNDIVVELSSIIKVSKYYYTMSRILKMLEHLPGNRLPTELQVLQRFEHMRKKQQY